ncbi:hypothetical protein AB9F29_08090 [Falsihalocynthiibacter sp. S25ZX9]
MLWPEAALTHNMVEVAPNMLKAVLGAVNSKILTFNAAFFCSSPWPDAGLPNQLEEALPTKDMSFFQILVISVTLKPVLILLI